jgi:glycosyltransferase involved in cell wall biosynthesis
MTGDASPASRSLVSVVVNNHNYDRFLADAIDSALAQTYVPVEVIVVDDGSTDNSREVIASYEGRITPVLKENGGQASAFNAGFRASKGEVVIFLDSDDVLFPEAVERAVALFQPGVVKVHWPLLKVDAQRRPLGSLQPPRILEDGDMRDLIIREGPGSGSSTPTSGNAWARSFLERVLPAPEEKWRISADGYLVTLAWVSGEVRAICEPQGLYRVHGDNHFASKPWQEREALRSQMFLRRCDALAAHLELQGINADAQTWKRMDSRYLWSENLRVVKEQIAALVPVGQSFILVDDDALSDCSGTDDVLAGRRRIPFLERDGEYAGLPENDAMALRELDRLRSYGPSFIVFPWFAFWWFDHYRDFAASLRRNSPCVLETERVTAFDLRG